MGMWRFALRNLLRRPSRTFLTILGVLVAVAFTVGILSISEGFLASFESTIVKYGADIYILPKEENMAMPFSTGVHSKLFPEKLAKEVSREPNVRTAVPVFRSLDLGPTMNPTLLFGVDPALFHELKPLAKLEAGQWLNDPEVEQALVGKKIAEAMALEVGSQISILERPFKVVGILQEMGTLDDSAVYLPIKVLQKIKGQPRLANEVRVRVKNLKALQNTVSLLRQKYPDLAVQTAAEILEQMMKLLTIAQALHFSIASISLLIGVLFVMSTMLMAVNERVREIGMMRALGTPRRYIFRMVLAESLAISVIAGIFGCIGGYFLSKAIAYLATQQFNLSLFPTMVSPRILAFGLGIALAVGGFAGLYPAWRISKINIVEALRYE